jgi:Pectate lyase superfamily protein/Major tropism determinant N-terminal domain
MATTRIATIQLRRGLKSDLPPSLNEGELGFCLDTNELFIGNSVSQGGNTQVLTTSGNLLTSAEYQYLSDTSVVSQTGPTLNQPTVRTLQQQVDDYWVNVKAYGAMGNGIDDDTAAINLALQDLYSKVLTTGESVLQAKKTLWFPSGTYLITSPILVWPHARLVGENARTTQIIMNTGTVQPSLVRLVDSMGQTGSNLGQNGASLPQQVILQDLNLYASNSQTVVLLENCNDVNFHRCVFSGSWAYGPDSSTQQTGINLQVLTGSIDSVSCIDCVFENLVWAIESSDPVSNIRISNCRFTELYRAFNMAALSINGGGPTLALVNTSVFKNIYDSAIYIASTNPGIGSIGNNFDNCGQGSSTTAIFWVSGSVNCTSIGDTFINCTPITNQGANNLILDSQITGASNLRNVQVAATSPVICTTNSDVIVVDLAVAGPSSVTLLSGATLYKGQTVTVKDGKGDANAHNITISCATANIDGQASYVINTNYGHVTLTYDGSQWRAI